MSFKEERRVRFEETYGSEIENRKETGKAYSKQSKGSSKRTLESLKKAFLRTLIAVFTIGFFLASLLVGGILLLTAVGVIAVFSLTILLRRLLLKGSRRGNSSKIMIHRVRMDP